MKKLFDTMGAAIFILVASAGLVGAQGFSGGRFGPPQEMMGIMEEGYKKVNHTGTPCAGIETLEGCMQKMPAVFGPGGNPAEQEVMKKKMSEVMRAAGLPEPMIDMALREMTGSIMGGRGAKMSQRGQKVEVIFKKIRDLREKFELARFGGEDDDEEEMSDKQVIDELESILSEAKGMIVPKGRAYAQARSELKNVIGFFERETANIKRMLTSDTERAEFETEREKFHEQERIENEKFEKQRMTEERNMFKLIKEKRFGQSGQEGSGGPGGGPGGFWGGQSMNNQGRGGQEGGGPGDRQGGWQGGQGGQHGGQGRGFPPEGGMPFGQGGRFGRGGPGDHPQWSQGQEGGFPGRPGMFGGPGGVPPGMTSEMMQGGFDPSKMMNHMPPGVVPGGIGIPLEVIRGAIQGMPPVPPGAQEFPVGQPSPQIAPEASAPATETPPASASVFRNFMGFLMGSLLGGGYR